jgi:hypothetical protein
MASAVVALGVIIYFSVKKISDHKDKKRALKVEAFVPHNITDKMAISGDSFTLLGYNDDSLDYHENSLPPRFAGHERLAPLPRRKKRNAIFSSLGLRGFQPT